MKLITLTTALAILAAPVFAENYQPPKEPEPPTVTDNGGGENDWLAPLVVIVGVGIAYHVFSQPKTANCDTISNQMIYGADGKPLVAAETDPCE